MTIACESSMPSLSRSLPMRLFRWGCSASLMRGADRSVHVSPPSVLRMTPLPIRDDVDPALLRELVTVGFSQRRKLLRHTVGRWLQARGADQPFDLQRRAEEVPVGEWIALAIALKKTTPEGSAPPSRRKGSEAGREQP